MLARHVRTPLRYFQKLHHEPLQRFPVGWFWLDHYREYITVVVSFQDTAPSPTLERKAIVDALRIAFPQQTQVHQLKCADAEFRLSDL